MTALGQRQIKSAAMYKTCQLAECPMVMTMKTHDQNISVDLSEEREYVFLTVTYLK